MTRTALVLHGGGGPATVAPLAAALAGTFLVEAPTHPGWNGTPAIEGDTIAALASRYLDALRAEGARDAVVVGSSIGGWIALEIALQDAAAAAATPGYTRVVGKLVLVDSVGVAVPDEPMRDISALGPRGLAEHAWADPEKGYIDPETMSPEQIATTQGNMASLRAYAGDPYMHDPGLLGRLGAIKAETLVIWGDADRIVTPAYGRALAKAIPDARFELVEAAGHLPHLERPAETLALVQAFL